MRRLSEVIDKMIEEIPPQYDIPLLDLRKLKEELVYIAPEMEQPWWDVCARILRELLGNKLDVVWKKRVINIWIDKE